MRPQVVPIKEQPLIPPMWLDVIDNGGDGDLPELHTVPTQGI